MPHDPADADITVDTLPNGVRAVVIRLPHGRTANVSVFVRTGSVHESRALNGVSHVVEHMVFKGTHTRDAHRINLDAERLGADVNAHTDKDHSAFYMRGLPEHAPRLLAMLADIVLHPAFPAAELEREREVLLSEHTEVEDDPMTAAYRLFDHACYGLHPAAQAVIGSRHNIERFSREDLAAYVTRQYTGRNVAVVVAGPVEPGPLVEAVHTLFGGLPAGEPHRVEPPVWHGGLRAKRLSGSPQTHLVLGFPVPPATAADATAEVAAAVLGDGMSSPLMAELRERRALVYYAACAADVLEPFGQFAVEASFAPDKLDELLGTVRTLLQAQAREVDAVDLERARHQLAVRLLHDAERPGRLVESAALDLFALGRVRSVAERVAQLHAVPGEAVRAAFDRMLATGLAAGLAGHVGRGVAERARELLGVGG